MNFIKGLWAKLFSKRYRVFNVEYTEGEDRTRTTYFTTKPMTIKQVQDRFVDKGYKQVCVALPW